MRKFISLIFCLVAGLFAKEWEQTIVIDPIAGQSWGFGENGIYYGYDSYIHWYVSEACVCDMVVIGGCQLSLYMNAPRDADEKFWRVLSTDSLVAGKTLNLDDTTSFKLSSNRSEYSGDDTYVFNRKSPIENDTAYFVYQKSSSYFALCQYITVYDVVDSREDGEGIPAHFAHQCVYQDEGTPTFSKIPMFADVLPESKFADIDRWSGFNGDFAEPRPRKTSENKTYLVNGKRNKGNQASHVNVEYGRTSRSLR